MDRSVVFDASRAVAVHAMSWSRGFFVTEPRSSIAAQYGRPAFAGTRTVDGSCVAIDSCARSVHSRSVTKAEYASPPNAQRMPKKNA